MPGEFFSGLLTDLYELTMAAAYVQNRFEARATFELFVRHLPRHRNYLVAAGLEQALDFLENVRFSDEEVSYLRALPLFRHVRTGFFDYLSRFRFTGDVEAVEEGTLIFAEEPVLRVTAPVAEAQIVETYLLSVINFETLVASKAARVVRAAGGASVLEFGTRRAHGPESGVRAARASLRVSRSLARCSGVRPRRAMTARARATLRRTAASWAGESLRGRPRMAAWASLMVRRELAIRAGVFSQWRRRASQAFSRFLREAARLRGLVCLGMDPSLSPGREIGYIIAYIFSGRLSSRAEKSFPPPGVMPQEMLQTPYWVGPWKPAQGRRLVMPGRRRLVAGSQGAPLAPAAPQEILPGGKRDGVR